MRRHPNQALRKIVAAVRRGRFFRRSSRLWPGGTHFVDLPVGRRSSATHAGSSYVCGSERRFSTSIPAGRRDRLATPVSYGLHPRDQEPAETRCRVNRTRSALCIQSADLAYHQHPPRRRADFDPPATPASPPQPGRLRPQERHEAARAGHRGLGGAAPRAPRPVLAHPGRHFQDCRAFWTAVGTGIPGSYRQRDTCSPAQSALRISAIKSSCSAVS
jgi:hypothetical protein